MLFKLLKLLYLNHAFSFCDGLMVKMRLWFYLFLLQWQLYTYDFTMGRKCVVTKCCSGYKPRKEKGLLRREIDPPKSRCIFSFPKHPKLRAQWISATQCRDDINLDHSGVCELHFEPTDFKTLLSSRTGKELQRPRLRNGVVPTIFGKGMKNARPTKLAKPSTRRSMQQQAINTQMLVFFEQDKIIDLEDLYNKLSQEILPTGFRYVLSS